MMRYGHGRKRRGMVTAFTGERARGRRTVRQAEKNIKSMSELLEIDYV
jgi:hypothetical protein